MYNKSTNAVAIEIERLSDDVIGLLKEGWTDAVGNGIPEGILASADQVVIEYVPMEKKLFYDFIEDMMFRHVELDLLYIHSVSEDTDYGQSCCLYFKPGMGRLMKLDIRSDSEGLVSKTVFTAYLHAEHLYGQLLYDIRRNLTIGRFMELRKKRELITDFC